MKFWVRIAFGVGYYVLLADDMLVKLILDLSIT